MYSAEIKKNRMTGSLRPGARTGATVCGFYQQYEDRTACNRRVNPAQVCTIDRAPLHCLVRIYGAAAAQVAKDERRHQSQ